MQEIAMMSATMEIDRKTLIRVLEAFADTLEVFQREVFLSQSLFFMACKAKGMNDEQIDKVIESAREGLSPKIEKACRDSRQSLLEKLPRIVDLLASDQEAALQSLREWAPVELPN
jgi:hypothetical protein